MNNYLKNNNIISNFRFFYFISSEINIAIPKCRIFIGFEEIKNKYCEFVIVSQKRVRVFENLEKTCQSYKE